MNDQDRGAYTPGGERPLAFDARGASTGGVGRSPAPWTLIGSAGVLVVVVVGLVMAYRGGGHASGESRAVGEPVASIKSAAPAGAQAATPAAMDVYAAQNVPASKPSFAPPPEAPAARPAPSGLTVRTVDATKVRIEPAEATPTAADRVASASAATAVKPGLADRTVVVAPTPVAKAAPKPVPVTETETTALTPTTKTTTAKTVAKAATPKPTTMLAADATTPKAVTVAKGAASVQIGAFSSRTLADKGWSDVSALMPGQTGGHGKAVESVDHDGKTLFRTAVTGFADRAAAKAYCDALQAKGHSCIVKG